MAANKPNPHSPHNAHHSHHAHQSNQPHNTHNTNNAHKEEPQKADNHKAEAPHHEAAAPAQNKDQALQDNMQLLRRLFNEVYSRPATADQLRDFVDQSVVLHDRAVADNAEGLDEFIAAEEEYQTAVPNKKTAINDIFGAGDKVAVRWTCSGIQERSFRDVKPSNKSFKVSGITIYRFSNGKISEVWQNWDRLSMLEQVGEISPALAFQS